MPKEEAIKTEGQITEVLPNQQFRVRLENDHIVLASLSGKMKKFYIKVTTGDQVALELSPYDLDRARITRRL